MDRMQAIRSHRLQARMKPVSHRQPQPSVSLFIKCFGNISIVECRVFRKEILVTGDFRDTVKSDQHVSWDGSST